MEESVHVGPAEWSRPINLHFAHVIYVSMGCRRRPHPLSIHGIYIYGTYGIYEIKIHLKFQKYLHYGLLFNILSTFCLFIAQLNIAKLETTSITFLKRNPSLSSQSTVTLYVAIFPGILLYWSTKKKKKWYKIYISELL